VITEAHLQGLEEALEHGGGTHNIEHVLAAVRRGEAQLWLDDDAAIVTEVNDTPNEKELHFWLATGTLSDVLALMNKVTEWGRTRGCTVATMAGRFGWKKILANEGWEPQMIVMGRRLDGQG